MIIELNSEPKSPDTSFECIKINSFYFQNPMAQIYFHTFPTDESYVLPEGCFLCSTVSIHTHRKTRHALIICGAGLLYLIFRLLFHIFFQPQRTKLSREGVTFQSLGCYGG